MMKHAMRLMNDGWEFLRTPLGVCSEDARRDDGWRAVALPHDFLIADSHHLYRDCIGWYRRAVDCPSAPDMRALIRFEGVYMDTTVFVNGVEVGQWKYGYSTFEFDVTDFLTSDGGELLVRVVHQSPNTRWYSGAGIYRSVWRLDVPSTYIETDGLYVHADWTGECWSLALSCELCGDAEGASIRYDVLSPSGKRYAITGGLKQTMRLPDEDRWDIDDPKLHHITATLIRNGEDIHAVTTRFGLRETRFSPDEGFLLNGRRVKMKGVCMHHDLGALGAAVNRAAAKRQLVLLRDMGVNAIRTSHNMPSVELLELCDEMGFLVIDEAFDMWEMSKTTYDYARFFNEWAARDVKSWVRRDRNHPCVVLFSIGNEIYDTHAGERGRELTRFLRDEVRRYDPLGNAPVTFGSNYLPWENTQKAADDLKIVGYNYTEKLYAAHHAAHPDWVIYGSETASVVHSRNVYHFPASVRSLADDDMQCSSLGNSVTSWGAQDLEVMLTEDRDTPYSMGQFVWTGFDYIGEPTPYKTKNSYFGQIDTAGFPKDSFYTFRACWKDAPTLHIAPYWDWNDGQMIDVLVSASGAFVKLMLNGELVGEQSLCGENGKRLCARFQVPYRAGILRAEMYDESGVMLAFDERASFGDTARIALSADKQTLRADGEDMLFVTLTAIDKDGHPVENACDRARVTVRGAGRLVGLDNGDSADYDSYKGVSRRLFGGKLLAMIAATNEPGDIDVTVECQGMPTARARYQAIPAAARVGSALMPESADLPVTDDGGIFIRKIALTSQNGLSLTAERPSDVVRAEIFPKNADKQEIAWRVCSLTGADTNLASVEPDGLTARVTARGDGQFCLRCMAYNGYAHPRVLSTLFYEASGLGAAALDPYVFVSASLATLREGDVGVGNERGVATPSGERGMFGFENVDFGAVGSDEITLPIFALNDEPYTLEIWDGAPPEGDMLGSYIYQKPSIWNTYQDATYTLPRRLTGVHTLCFVGYNKMHVKGFVFKRYAKAYEKLPAAGCDSVTGDEFTLRAPSILGIGNNVTVSFDGMDFGDPKALTLTLYGRAIGRDNTLQLRVTDESGQSIVAALECARSDAPRTYAFSVPPTRGTCSVSLVFMPGCRFDLDAIQFSKN